MSSVPDENMFKKVENEKSQNKIVNEVYWAKKKSFDSDLCGLF